MDLVATVCRVEEMSGSCDKAEGVGYFKLPSHSGTVQQPPRGLYFIVMEFF